MIKYILLLIVLILINSIIKSRDNKHEKNNLILREILEIAYTSQLVDEAGVKIINILNQYFEYDYSTIYRYNKKRDLLDVLCTTANNCNLKDLTDIGNILFNENKNKTDAYIETSNIPLKYNSTISRNIRYLYFIPLKTNNYIIGALLIEKFTPYDKKHGKVFETDFFKTVTETITLALQNLIYFEQITNSAYLDGLTEVYNRKYMDIYIPKKVKSYSDNDIPFSIVIYDIDYFKNFNDNFGHQFGDLVLKELSQFVGKNIRETDVLFRYGGEEFVIFMPNIDEETTFNRIDNIREAISNLILTDDKGTSAQINCSFGIVTSGENRDTVEELINRADKALYYSKNNGRNRTTVYKEELFFDN